MGVRKLPIINGRTITELIKKTIGLTLFDNRINETKVNNKRNIYLNWGGKIMDFSLQKIVIEIKNKKA